MDALSPGPGDLISLATARPAAIIRHMPPNAVAPTVPVRSSFRPRVAFWKTDVQIAASDRPSSHQPQPQPASFETKAKKPGNGHRDSFRPAKRAESGDMRFSRVPLSSQASPQGLRQHSHPIPPPMSRSAKAPVSLCLSHTAAERLQTSPTLPAVPGSRGAGVKRAPRIRCRVPPFPSHDRGACLCVLPRCRLSVCYAARKTMTACKARPVRCQANACEAVLFVPLTSFNAYHSESRILLPQLNMPVLIY